MYDRTTENDRKTGGAGVRRQPLSDDDYRRAIEQLHRLNAADATHD